MFLKTSLFDICFVEVREDYFLCLFSGFRVEAHFPQSRPVLLLQVFIKIIRRVINPLSANATKWSNTLKQFVGNLPTTCLSLFDHFVKLTLKGLKLWTTEKRDVSSANNLRIDDKSFDKSLTQTRKKNFEATLF